MAQSSSTQRTDRLANFDKEDAPKKEANTPKVDPNAAPAVGESWIDKEERLAIEAMENARADAKAPRYNKDHFYGPRGTEYRETRLDHQQGPDHLHFITAEELAWDILGRAGIANSHPELALAVAAKLKEHLKPVMVDGSDE